MNNIITIEQKIITYICAGWSEKKPRITTKQVVEYANSKGANWTIRATTCEKRTSCVGMRYSTGGGTREYNGYRVYDGSKEIYNSTETYRTIYDLIRELPNYEELTANKYN